MKTTTFGVSLALVASLTAGCGEAPEARGTERLASISQAFTETVDLISPANCILKSNRLGQCTIPTRTISGATIQTAVPLRTRIERTVSGNCTIRALHLAVKFTSSIVPTVAEYKYMDMSAANDEVVLRRRAGTPISSITMTDVGLNTAVALFPAACRVSLKFIVNEVDVDSTEDAQEIIQNLETTLAQRIATQQSYEHLLQLSAAFGFLRAVAESFRVELTNENIQMLRTQAESAVGSLALLSGACDGMMTDEDRQNMMLLMLGLPQLGNPADWSHPDGTPKTLEEFMGESSAEIYQTVTKVVETNTLPDGQTYESLLAKAATDTETARAKLELAKSQLAAWL